MQKLLKKTTIQHPQPAARSVGKRFSNRGGIGQAVLAVVLTLLFTSPSPSAQATEPPIAPSDNSPATSNVHAPNTHGGGGSGETTAPCSTEAIPLQQILAFSKGISAMAAAEPGTTTSSILVVVKNNRSGAEDYTKIKVMGRKGAVLMATDCLGRLEPGPYTVVATSNERLQQKTILLANP